MERKKLIDFLKRKKSSYVFSVLFAMLSVFFGLLPYFIIYKILLNLSNRTLDQYNLIIYSSIIISSFVFQILFHDISTIISHKTAFKILKDIRLSISKKMMKMPLGQIQLRGQGYFHNMLIDSIERLEYPFAHAIPETISNSLIPILGIVYLFFADWKMGFVISIPLILTFLFYIPMYIGIMNGFANIYYKSLEEMNGRVIEFIRGNKEIKIFGQGDTAYSKFEESIDNYRDSTLKFYNKMYFAIAPSTVLLSSILIFVLSIGGFLYINGNIEAPIYLLSIILSIGISQYIFRFVEFMDNFYHIRNGKILIEEILNTSELLELEDSEKEIENYNIEFKDVSFAYENKNILENISIIIPENKKTAIVGPSGSGKTTIANLIARFWDPDIGSISIGEIDYKEIPINQLMRNINYVTQDQFLFNMSILENIRIGKRDASKEEVKKAAKMAECTEFIEELENDYETIVGDEGSKLSGGQRQRLIIARAILRNAPILVLDEATAYTDFENQDKIQKSIKELCKDKTLIVIAHRLSTVKDFDQIIVMNEGRIDSIGTHQDLLDKSYIYKNMWNINSISKNWILDLEEEK